MNIKVKDLYFRPYISKQQIDEKIQLIAQKIVNDYHGKRPLIISVLNGSFIFCADLLRELTIEFEIEFIRLKSYEGTKTTGEVKELLGLIVDVAGRDILIVEDIIDTGKTLHDLIQLLNNKDAGSIKVASLLLKPDKLQYNLVSNYNCFEIGNEFVVGYGLDYDGLGRNLKDIYVVVPN